MEITIEVLEKDIIEGQQSSTQFCPIALALDRMEFTGVRVATDAVEVSKLTAKRGRFEETFIGDLPMAAQSFIEEFDGLEDYDLRLRMKPIKFNMELRELRHED